MAHNVRRYRAGAYDIAVMYMKKGQQIKVIEYVHTADGGLARVDQLDPGQYETFRRWLGCTYLNELFRGKAEFYYPETAGGQRPPLQ